MIVWHPVWLIDEWSFCSMNYLIFKLLIMKSTINLHLQSSWDEVKEKLKENDHTLTDEDLDYSVGNEEELIGRLEKIMGKSREQVIAYIESISANTDLAG
jgi:uncharacterized protein YjbJ (UPF0337 family)